MPLNLIPPPLQHPVIGPNGMVTVAWASYFRSLSTAIDGEFAGLTAADIGLGNVQNVDQTDADNLTSGTVATARLPDAALIGYALMGYGVSSGALTDGQTLYWGGQPGESVTTTPAVRKIYIPKAGTITACYAWALASTTGSGEAWPLYIRVNDTTDYLIQQTVAAETYRFWGRVDASVPVEAGDFIEFKMVNPTWASNPTIDGFGGCVYVS